MTIFERFQMISYPSLRKHLLQLPKSLLLLTALYFLTSLGHFAHNAQFICEYPNLPAWLTPWKVMAVWVAITLVGVAGFGLMAQRWMACGLLLVAVYAALGFDGLGHYAVAPMAFHTLGANVTILSEVVAAALLLPFALYLVVRRIFQPPSAPL